MTKTLAYLLATTTLAFGATCHAEAAPADNGKPVADAGIAEIVVTANRVETAAQKTAVALTVYSGADLLAKGVSNVNALATVDPSVNVVSQNGSAYVAVRGIASADVTEVGDPAVPIARDGFFTNRSYSIQAGMYDVARVEVLKGPQGTLNGRNSTGGLISITTNRPDFKDGGYIAAGVGNYGAFHSEAAVNLALSDTFAIRASTVYDYHAGYRNVTGILGSQTERGDDEDFASGRIQVAWKPAPAISLWASYQHDSLVGVGDVAESLPIEQMPVDLNAKTFANGSPTTIGLTGNRFRWEFKDDELPLGLRFVYSGGFDKEAWHHALDFGPVGANGLNGTGYPAYSQFLELENPKTWNHEVRFSNDPHSRLFVQAGWFHFTEDNALSNGVYNVAMAGAFAPGGPLAGLSQAGNYGIYFNFPTIDTRSDGVFGYMTYALSDEVKFSAGARETWDEKSRTGIATLSLQALVSPFIPPYVPPIVTLQDGSVNTKAPSFHVGLDWNPSAHSLVYAKFDTGYKAGGYNSNGSQAPVPYAPEKVASFEIGTKNRFLDNHLQFNLDAFYMHYSGYQASQFTASIGAGLGVFNVGSANIYGAEANIIAQSSGGTQFDINATALHTAFEQGITVVNGATPPQSYDIGGNHLPLAPALSFTAGLQQTLAFAGGSVTGRIEGKYSSSYFFSIFNLPDVAQGTYMTGNATLTYKPAHGNWQIEAYVRNFTDKTVFANAQENFTAGYNTYEFLPPRTFGASGRIKF